MNSLSADLMRAVVEEASDGIVITDDTEFRIEWINPAGCALLGFTAEQLVGRRIAELVWDEDELKRLPLFSEALRAGRTTMSARKYRTAQNTPRVLEVSSRRIGDGRVVGIVRDTTERQVAEERVRRSEASFRMLIERSPCAVVVHRKNHIVYANPEAARSLGFADPKEAIGQNVIQFVHPDEQPRISERNRALEAGEFVSFPFTEQRLRRVDGSELTGMTGGMVVEFEGEPSIVVIGSDVTEQRRVEEQLVRADRLSSLGTLAAGVAHEINNPLTYVMLHLDAIRMGVTAGNVQELLEHADRASEGAQRVARIVRDLSAFSRTEHDVRQPTDVRRPIEIAINTATHELKHRARVVQDLDAVPLVSASEGRLAQVILNLLLNAGQAIPPGRPDANEIRVTTRRKGAEVHIAVRDTGTGISEANRKRLFEPFFTTKPVGEGTGLGLAICHGLVVALGGRIEVESELGRGSTFTIVLPAFEAEGTEHPRGQRQEGRARVLVVDDEPAICAAMASALERRCVVVTETSAHAACALLEKDDDFDAVVCDVVMPEMTGHDVHAWITKQRPQLADRIVFVSGGRADSHTDIPRARWLDKPFTLDALEGAIVNALRR